LDVIAIGLLRVEGWSAGGEIGHHHIGDDGARLGQVEGNQGWIHGGLFELLASAQEFGIDGADLVE
jgi:hypothetical protein